MADHLAENDAHALELVRTAIKNINKINHLHILRETPHGLLLDAAELDGAIPANPRTPFDVREIIARISVMGGEQAAGVLAQVKRDALEKHGGTWRAGDEAALKQPILEQ